MRVPEIQTPMLSHWVTTIFPCLCSQKDGTEGNVVIAPPRPCEQVFGIPKDGQRLGIQQPVITG